VTRAFDVAWFFHVSPAEVLRLDVRDFLVWEANAYRIAETQRRSTESED
jgi:hypothetical protein